MLTAAAFLSAAAAGLLSAGCGSSGGYHDTSPMWSPGGRMIAFTRIREGELGDLYVMRSDGTEVRRLAHDATNPAWSPDGERIAFDVLATDSDGLLSDEVWMVDVDDGSLKRLTRNTVDDYHPAWSPDGTELAFVRGGIAETSTLAVMNLASKKVRVVFGERLDSSEKLWPTWSPDGRRLAFVAGIFPERLFLVDADGGGGRKIAVPSSIEQIGPPRWSPDGRSIVFNGGPVGLSDRGEIYRVDANGRGLARLTNDRLTDTADDWSPHGDRVLFTAGPPDDPDRVEIYSIGANGAGRVRLTKNDVDDEGGDISPDGSRIAFSRDSGDGLLRIHVMDSQGDHVRKLTYDSP